MSLRQMQTSPLLQLVMQLFWRPLTLSQNMRCRHRQRSGFFSSCCSGQRTGAMRTGAAAARQKTRGNWWPNRCCAHLENLGAVQPVAHALAHHLRWVNQVLQGGLVHLRLTRLQTIDMAIDSGQSADDMPRSRHTRSYRWRRVPCFHGSFCHPQCNAWCDAVTLTLQPDQQGGGSGVATKGTAGPKGQQDRGSTAAAPTARYCPRLLTAARV